MLEDNANDAKLIQEALNGTGMSFSFRREENKEEFIEGIKEFTPDLILSDFSMPSFDGMTALSIARTLCPDVPFVFVSGTIGEENAVESLKMGATDYILKDRPARLISSVRSALEQARERAERKRVEENLRKSEELFRLISENVADLIAVLDLNGRRLYNSPSYRDILGDPASFSGTDSFAEIHPDDRDRIKHMFNETVRTGIGQRADFRFIDKNKKIRYIESQGSVIRDADEEVSKVVLVSRDVTERMKAEHDREVLERQLRQAQKMESIGTLAGGVAHDFNNILGIILGYSTLLQKPELAPKKHSESIEIIQKAVDRGSSLVTQLMTFARKTDAVYQAVSVNDVIAELIKMVEATFPKTIKCGATLDKNIPVITADPSQVNQAVLNLCVNARDAMPDGGTLSVGTGVVQGETLRSNNPSAASENYISITVKDTGTGMDEPTRNRIFEPFFTTKELGKGTGLGLAVVYGVVKGHDGFINVESELGVGTTFSLFLPVKHHAAQFIRKKDLSMVTVKGGTETILFVEDEEMLVSLVEAVLTANGYRVLIARTGKEAIELHRLYSHEIALVLSDIGLPELNGWDALMRMRETNPQLKAVVATGYLDDESKTRMLQMGVSSILQKPYVPHEILRAVRTAIDAPL